MNGVIKINDPEYPCLLKEINRPPGKLYYKGNWDINLFEKCLTVVGSRKMTSYGKQTTNKLIKEIAEAGITIVSGFMYGVDATAHKAAINAGGKTIAVMPCGIDIIHPKYQEDLYSKILEDGGLVISEFESTFPPAIWTYPKRNRIMAGLSRATLVVEAGIKSGSLITADLAKKYKRKLFAVPGPLTSTLSQGTVQLIREGADIVINEEDILAVYGLKKSGSSSLPSQQQRLNKLESSIVEKLQQEPMEIDNLSRLVKIPVSLMGTTLSLMYLKGLLSEEKGKYYVN